MNDHIHSKKLVKQYLTLITQEQHDPLDAMIIQQPPTSATLGVHFATKMITLVQHFLRHGEYVFYISL